MPPRRPSLPPMPCRHCVARAAGGRAEAQSREAEKKVRWGAAVRGCGGVRQRGGEGRWWGGGGGGELPRWYAGVCLHRPPLAGVSNGHTPSACRHACRAAHVALW